MPIDTYGESPATTDTNQPVGTETTSLNHFLTGVDIKDGDGAAIPLDGSGKISIGADYVITLTFFIEANNEAINNPTVSQVTYDKNDYLTYQLPDGLIVPSPVSNQPVLNGSGAVIGSYSANASGLVTVALDNLMPDGTPAPEASNYPAPYPDAHFTLAITAQFANAGESSFDFGNGNHIVLTVEQPVQECLTVTLQDALTPPNPLQGGQFALYVNEPDGLALTMPAGNMQQVISLGGKDFYYLNYSTTNADGQINFNDLQIDPSPDCVYALIQMAPPAGYAMPHDNVTLYSFAWQPDIGGLPVTQFDGAVTVANILSRGLRAAPIFNIATPIDMQGFMNGTLPDTSGTTTAALHPEGIYNVTANIDMTGLGSFTNGPFGITSPGVSGVLEGNGCTISNLSVSGNSNYLGVIPYVTGTVADINFDTLTVTNAVQNATLGQIGTGLIGYLSNGTVQNVNLTGETVIQNTAASSGTLFGACAGGVAGYVGGANAKIIDVSNASTASPAVRGSNQVGGIVGYMIGGSFNPNGGVVSNAAFIESTVDIAGQAANVGGIVGYVYANAACAFNGTLQNSGSINSKPSNSNVGGIIGNSANYIGAASIVSGATLNNSGVITGGYSVGGLFGVINALVISPGVTLTNTASVTATVSAGTAFAGGIWGQSSNLPTISDVTMSNSAKITGMNAVGGIGGRYAAAAGAFIDGTKITQTGEITGTTTLTSSSIGGIMGEITSGTMTNFINGDLSDTTGNSGKVSGSFMVGGIVGSFTGGTIGSPEGKIINYGAVTATGSNGTYFAAAGGIAGFCNNVNAGFTGSIQNSAPISATAANGYSVGGIVGYFGNGSTSGASFTNKYLDDTFSAAISGPGNYYGGIVGWMNNASAALYSGTNDASVTSMGGSIVGGIVGYMQAGKLDGASVNNGTVYCKGNQCGGIAGQFNGVVASGATLTVNASGTANDISAAGTSVGGIFGQLGPGGAVLAGASLINNATISGTAASTVTFANGIGGIIGYVNSNVSNTFSGLPADSATAAIWILGPNVAITSAGTSTSASTGGYVGNFSPTAASTIQNTINRMNVKGTATVGGIAGTLSAGNTLTTSYNVGSVSGTNTIGGLVGANAGTVSDSYNIGSVYASAGTVGGLIGSAATGSAVANCYNAGPVSGGAPAGALLGSAALTVIPNGCIYDSVTSMQPYGYGTNAVGSTPTYQMIGVLPSGWSGSTWEVDANLSGDGVSTYPYLAYQRNLGLSNTYKQTVAYSTDGGATWQPLSMRTAIPASGTVQIKATRLDANNVFNVYQTPNAGTKLDYTGSEADFTVTTGAANQTISIGGMSESDIISYYVAAAATINIAKIVKGTYGPVGPFSFDLIQVTGTDGLTPTTNGYFDENVVMPESSYNYLVLGTAGPAYYHSEDSTTSNVIKTDELFTVPGLIEGTYYYQISEHPQYDGSDMPWGEWTCDSNAYVVTVAVNSIGDVTITYPPSYPVQTGDAGDALVFMNWFSSAAEVNGTKRINGLDNANETNIGKTFKFDLNLVSTDPAMAMFSYNYPVTANSTVALNGAGDFKFDLNHLAPGVTYHYQLAEEQDNDDPKWTYDTMVINVTVAVDQQGQITVTYPDLAADAVPTFTNRCWGRAFPDAGGPGTNGFLFGGGLLVLLSLCAGAVNRVYRSRYR